MSGKLQLFEKSLLRLAEALAVPAAHPLALDGSIQRFEFCFELGWKAAQQHLQDEGVEAGTPRQVMQKAFGLGWISDEALWLEMLRDRNLTVHTYREEQARAVYAQLPRYLVALCDLAKKIAAVQ